MSKRVKTDDWEKLGSSNLSVRLFASMYQSKAFLDLSNNAKVLYIYMKTQQYGAKAIPGQTKDCFYFNKAMYTKTYPLYKNGEQFQRDINQLVKNGFIEITENGKSSRTKNIYKFSGNWKHWNYGDDFRPLAMQKKDEELKAKRNAQRIARNK